MAVSAAGVRTRAVHAVGDGRCCDWVLAVFSPSGKVIWGLSIGAIEKGCHQVVVLWDSPHVRLQITYSSSQASRFFVLWSFGVPS